MQPMDVEVIIEIPRGSRNKYEIDHETGAVWLDRNHLDGGRLVQLQLHLHRTRDRHGADLQAEVAA